MTATAGAADTHPRMRDARCPYCSGMLLRAAPGSRVEARCRRCRVTLYVLVDNAQLIVASHL